MSKKNRSLQKSVRTVLEEYLADLDGEQPCNLYEMIMSEIEKPLLNTVMQYCENNQSKAATCLGINRGTLRKKLHQYQLIE